MYVACIGTIKVYVQSPLCFTHLPVARLLELQLVFDNTVYQCLLMAVDFDSSDHEQLTNSSPECVGSPTQALSPTVV